ncbi:hypothetical protein PIB30_039176 [Stylosanthes scabra]|uniref:Uncharacterized protein n=1 Tax=Stylosanthes scabra TaxID=79078 RepID=A0ABU6WFJ2_9FABA|nr:hypothetical protein [Stylosanthes scabra]
MHNHLSHKPPTFCLGTSGYADSPKTPRRYILYIGAVCGNSPQRDRFIMVNQDEEGVVYTDHSGEGSIAKISTRRIGSQRHGQRRHWGRQSQCGFGRRPKRTTSPPSSTPAVEVFQVQSTELVQAAIATTKTNIDLKPQTFRRDRIERISHRSGSEISLAIALGEQSRTPPRRRRYHSSSESKESSSEGDHRGRRRVFRRYKKTRGWEITPPIDGHTPFSSRILKVQPPRHFIKPTDIDDTT